MKSMTVTITPDGPEIVLAMDCIEQFISDLEDACEQGGVECAGRSIKLYFMVETDEEAAFVETTALSLHNTPKYEPLILETGQEEIWDV